MVDVPEVKIQEEALFDLVSYSHHDARHTGTIIFYNTLSNTQLKTLLAISFFCQAEQMTRIQGASPGWGGLWR